MVFKSAKSAIRHLMHGRFKSAEDYFRKRTRFGEINEFFKYQIISTDSEYYTLPFIANPFRAAKEKASWPDRQDLSYEYPDDEPAKQGSGTRRSEALGHFAIAYDLVKDRVGADAMILDVGCNTGFFLDQFHNKGFTNLHGIEPQAKAVEYARRTRPYLTIKEGFFGPRQNDLPCDLLAFFQTITRIPYQERLFDAIDRSARKYVLVSWVEDSCTLFSRDLHVGLAKMGFLCIEKRVFNPDLVPFGKGANDGALIANNANGERVPHFTSHFLFRRIEPRS